MTKECGLPVPERQSITSPRGAEPVAFEEVEDAASMKHGQGESPMCASRRAYRERALGPTMLSHAAMSQGQRYAVL